MLLALAGGLAPLPAPAVAAVGTETFVTMFSDPSDYVGDGTDRFFFPGNAEITIEGDASELTVSVSGGNHGDDFTFTFEGPDGQRLREGEYVRAQRAPFQAAGRPGMDVSGNGRGCNELSGRFRVKRIVEGAGGVTSLWIVYEQHCEGGYSALFGEVRYQVPGDGGVVTVGPREVRWPDAEVGQWSMKPLPVTVANPSAVPVDVGTSSVGGAAAGDFSVRDDRCSGVTLAPGDWCTVWVLYVPGAPGLRTATLTVPDSASVAHAVALEGFAFGGSTRFVVSGDPGDPVAGPTYNDFSPQNARLIVRGDREKVEAYVIGKRGVWTLELDAPDGDVLAPGGTYVDEDENDSFDGPGARIAISGNGTGCTGTGTFTVSEIEVGDYGELERFAASFEHHCAATFPAMRGILDFRAEEASEAPPRFPAYKRKVSLSLGNGVVSGAVMSEGPRLCRARVQVALLVWKEDRPRLVKLGRTDSSGRYRMRVRPLKGYYQAFVPFRQLGDGSICHAAVSRVRSTA